MMKSRKETVKDADFGYKLYEAVFLSLLLGSLVVMMNTKNVIRTDIWNILTGNMSFIFPIMIAIVVYYTVYSNRFNFDKDFQFCTYLATGFLAVLVISLFQEIIPLVDSICGKELQGFSTLYFEGAVVHPVSSIGLGMLSIWMYKKVFDRFFLGILIFLGFEIIVTAKFIIESLRMKISVFIMITLILYFIFVMYNRYRKFGGFRIKRRIQD